MDVKKPTAKWSEWEYWPFHWVYGPIYLIFVWYVIRSGFRFFFSASNPTIYSGGFLMESKKKVYDLLPSDLYPATHYFEPGVTEDELLQAVEVAGLAYPLVLKPDIGGKGRGVVIAHDAGELVYFGMQYTLPFLVQAWVPFSQEAGIFFVKQPGQSAGRVTGVVGKSFGMVTGDGIRTIRSLIEEDDRLSRYADTLFPALQDRLHQVPEEGVTELLMPFGNHARGATFYNWQHLIDDRLHQWASQLASQIEGFHYGRLDVRFNSWEEMLRGENFSIIELNGAGSEPTHIYDSSQSIFYAWKEIIRHWRLLWRVSHANHKRGAAYMSLKEGSKMFADSKAYDAELDRLHLQLLKRPQLAAEAVPGS